MDGRASTALTPAQDRRALIIAIAIPGICLIVLWSFFAFLYFALGPETIIPTHWNFANEVDASGTPIALLPVPIIATGITAFFMLIGISTRRFLYLGERGWGLFLVLFPAILVGFFIGLMSFLYLPYL